MATNLQTSSEPSLTSIVSGIIHDFQDLIKQQMDLFKTEVAADIRKTKDATAALALGASALFVGIVFLCLMVVELLHQFASFPYWASYLLVGGVIFVIGAILTAVGWSQFHSVSADQTVKSLEENLEWKTKPK
jgi:inner membrane protein involved in colicin E2 resistance